MIYEFANGTARQQALWEEALGHLLHLPGVQLTLTNQVTFVDPSEMPSGHTGLAQTTYTYDSPESTTLVRNDAPTFGPNREVMEALATSLGIEFSVEKFYMESAIHELGHALYAALPESSRVAIAEMFGAGTDDPSVLQPKGTPWEDHISEAIAETFKEAFLPRRFRVFANRTNKRLPYHRYPEFRALWRSGVPNIAAKSAVPGYDFDIFKRGGFGVGSKWFDPRKGLYSGKTGGGFNFESQSTMQVAGDPVEVEGAHHFAFSSWTFPRALLEQIVQDQLPVATEADLILRFEAKIGTDILARWQLFFSVLIAPEFEREHLEELSGFQGITETIPGGGEPLYVMWFGKIEATILGAVVNPPTISGGGGLGGLLPPFTISCEFTSDWPKSELKKLEVFASLHLGFEAPLEKTLVYIEALRATIPDFHFHQGGFQPGEGEEVVVPPSSVEPQGFLRGSRPKRHSVMGTAT